MEKIKTFIKETNRLAIFSFLIAIFGLYYGFPYQECNNVAILIGLVAFLTGIVALVRLSIKKQKGEMFAILGMLLGLLASVLVKRC
jgi:uncharacterized membrane protein HdeD (DUF308 family)